MYGWNIGNENRLCDGAGEPCENGKESPDSQWRQFVGQLPRNLPVHERPCEVVAGNVSQWRRFMILVDNVVLPIDERDTPKNEVEVETRVGLMETGVTHQANHEYFPIFMIGISIIQLIFYIAFDDSWLTLMIGYDPHRRHEIWRYFTAKLVHSSVSHLCQNLVMQLILGVLLEIVHRWKRIAIIYLASGFGGILFASVFNKTEYTVGASAGVMGLLFSHLATVILNWNAMDYKFSRIFCVLLYIVWQICHSVYSESLLGQQSNISHASHFGGAVTGFLVSILVLKTYKKYSWRKSKQWICIGLLITILVIVFLINVISPYYPDNEWNFNYMQTFQKYAAIKYNVTKAIHFPAFRNNSVL